MSISILGILLGDWIFIGVALFSNYIPGGYWFLVVGSVVDGCFGGVYSYILTSEHPLLIQISQASLPLSQLYMLIWQIRRRRTKGELSKDATCCESQRSRSHAFSTGLGLISCGMALGPTLGGFLIRFTGNPLSVFYLATSLHILYALIICFVIPESLGVKRMLRARTRYNAELRSFEDTLRSGRNSVAVRLAIRLKSLVSFLTPLLVLAPVSNSHDVTNPKRRKRDWNLTLIAVGYGLMLIAMMVGFE